MDIISNFSPTQKFTPVFLRNKHGIKNCSKMPCKLSPEGKLQPKIFPQKLWKNLWMKN
jgi:hypothetical protein